MQTEPEIFDKGIDQTKTTDAKDVTVIINKCLDVVSSVTQDNPKTPPKIVPATHVASNSVPQVSIGSRAREVGTSRIRALSAPKQRVESSFGVAKRSINTSPPTCIKKSNDNVTDVTKSADCSKKIDIGLSNEMKADSISSLSSTSFGSHSWADRVRGGHQEANGIMTPTTEEDEESFLLQDGKGLVLPLYDLVVLYFKS